MPFSIKSLKYLHKEDFIEIKILTKCAVPHDVNKLYKDIKEKSTG